MQTTCSDLLRPSINADGWGRYYTADWISRHLISSIEVKHPNLILELGVGKGALVEEAKKRWGDARVITVDVDINSTNHVRSIFEKYNGLYTHFIHDVLDHELESHIGIPLGSVDVAICNPPYVRPRWRAQFSHILEDAGLSGVLKTVHDAGADLLFIAQNLRFLKRGGKLGLIIPDGLITAEKFSGVRKALLRDHHIEQVIQLPRRVFSNTDAQAYLVVLSKNSGKTEQVELRGVDSIGELSPPIFISSDLAEKRLDFTYHYSKMKNVLSESDGVKSQRLGDCIRSLSRGKVSSHQISSFKFPVFHLSDFDAGFAVPSKFILSNKDLELLPKNINVAYPGDVLLARVGRNLHEKVSVVSDGPVVVSDCVLILRVENENRQSVIDFFKGDHGREALEATAHGVGARYITQADVLGLEMVN